jgi:hypothetical protein
MGNDNTAVGDHALTSQTGEGPNTAVGSGALFNNTLGDSNTANGTFALFNNTVGDSNTATGFQALQSNSMGSTNTAVGNFALLSNVTGNNNTAIGASALSGTTGSDNIGVGFQAGAFVGSSGNVIAIGSPGDDVDNSCFIGNIRDVQTHNADAIAVVVDSAGQLGTASSSARFRRRLNKWTRPAKPSSRLSQ